jgi:hypothetical protein
LKGYGRVPQPAPFRTVALDGGAGAVWQLELRALKVSLDRLPQLHAILDWRVRRMRSVAEFTVTTLVYPERHEAATLIVVRRRAAATRGDNVFLAWSRVASRTFKLEATLLRRVWTDCPIRTGGSFQLDCDARAASKPYALACRRVVEAALVAGAKALSHSTDALPPLPAQSCASLQMPSRRPGLSSCGGRPCARARVVCSRPARSVAAEDTGERLTSASSLQRGGRWAASASSAWARASRAGGRLHPGRAYSGVRELLRQRQPQVVEDEQARGPAASVSLAVAL